MSIERILKKSMGKQVPKKNVAVQPLEASASGLEVAIDQFLSSRNTTNFKKINGFAPSYTRTCKRWWFLLFKGAPSTKTFGPRLYRIFDNGHKVHERLYEYFEAMGILVDSEIPIRVNDPVPIVGIADGIINWGGNKLIELKSINEDGFQFRKMYKKPKDDHMIQTQIYLHALKMDEGFIIYEAKNSQSILVFPVKKDDEIYDKKIRQWKRVYDKVVKDELPKRPYAKDSKQCSDCDLFNYCWNELTD